MSCNCTTDKAIQQLYQRYGEARKASIPEKFSHKVGFYLRNFAVAICMIPISIYLFLFVFYKAKVKNENISLAEFFGFK